jgi:hypothetical protein
MSAKRENTECVPIIFKKKNIEKFTSDELLVPLSNDLLEVNKFYYISNLDESNNDVMKNIPADAGPTNFSQPCPNPMPTIGPNSVKKSNLKITNDVKPNDMPNFQDKPLDDSKNKVTKSPEEIITPELLAQNQNVNHISVENGLPPVPSIQDYNLNNKTKKEPVVKLNDKPVVVGLPLKVPTSYQVGIETPEDYKETVLKVTSGVNKKFFKKLIMYICIAVILYLVYKLFSNK